MQVFAENCRTKRIQVAGFWQGLFPGAFAQMFSAVDRRHTDAEIRAEAICDAMAGRGR
jgi:hypothetical protein